MINYTQPISSNDGLLKILDYDKPFPISAAQKPDDDDDRDD